MTPSQSVATQRSWRLRDPRETRAKSKRTRFVIWLALFALLVLCIVAFLYVIWDHRYTYVGVLVTQHDPLAVPYIAFQENDKKALRQLIEGRLANRGEYKTLSDSTGLEEAVNQFANWDAGKRDAAILYVSTHGIVHDGKAYLLESKFLSPDSKGFTDGLYEVGELLRRLSDSNAGIKLLLLDAGCIAYDPRLGIIVNDFPDLLEQVVRDEVEDSRLWVLVSHSTGQVSGADSRVEQSLFGQSVVAGLGGAADQYVDGDGDVMLHELYDYVWSDITRWTVSERSLQTPMLLQGGRGRVGLERARGCDIVLAHVPEQEPDDEEAKEAEEAEEASGADAGAAAMRWRWPRGLGLAWVSAWQTSDSVPAEKAAKPAAVGQESAAAAKSPPAKSPPASGNVAERTDAGILAPKKVLDEPRQSTPGEAAKVPTPAATSPDDTAAKSPATTLQQIWRVRDRLVRSRSRAWSPIDFAPTSWRRLEASLVGREARSHRGTETDDSDLVSRLNDLKTLAVEIETGVQGSYQTREVSQIAKDWRDFARDRQRQVLELPEMQTLTSAWQLCNRLFYELPSFIRWQAHTVLNEHEVTCSDALRRNSIEQLAELRNLLGNKDLTPEMEKSIRARYDELATTHEELHRALRRACARANEAKPSPKLDRMLDALLATPLLDAGQRSQLLLKRATGPTMPPVAGTPVMESPPPPWEALRKIVAWEVEYVRLCDPSERSLNVPPVLGSSNGRALGKDFQAYYEKVPTRIGDSRNPALVWLVDPRDLPRSQLAIRRPTLPQVGPPPVPVKLEIAGVAGPFHLQWHKPVKAVIAFEGQGLKDNQVTVRLQYDTTQLIARRTLNGAVLARDASFEYPLSDASDHELVLYLESTKLADSAAEPAALVVKLSGVDPAGMPRRTEQRLVCHLPLPSDVAVWVARHNDDPKKPLFKKGSQLNPYPNRTTPIKFLLANRSRIGKTVKVELYAIPNPRQVISLPPNWAPGRIFVDGALRDDVSRLVLEGEEKQLVRPDVCKLAEALVELPIDEETLCPIGFQPPGSLTPKPPAGDSSEAAKTPSAVPKPPSGKTIDVTHGMAMVITNADDLTDRIVKWIGILPVHPSQYLNVASVRCDGKRVRAVVELRSPQSIPAVRDLPVRVVWDNLDTTRFINRALVAQLSDEPDRERDELWADVPPNTPRCSVQLTVDRYPRAFTYDIRCAENETGRPLANRQLAIRIVGLTPLYQDNAAAPGGENPEEQPVEIPVVTTPDGSARVAIRSDPENPCTYLVARLEIDVPENAFESGDPLASVRVDGRDLYCDRQVQTTLDKLGPAGTLLLTSRVSDHQVPINVEGKTSVIIRAELRKRDEEGRSSQIAVILDGMAPRVASIDNLPPKIETGKPLSLDVEFTDHGQSGVAQLVVAIDVDGSGTIDDGDIQKSVSVSGNDEREHLVLATDELKPSSDGYRVLAQVTDSVGISSAVRESDTIVRVEAMKKKVASPKLTKGTIRGTLVANNRPARLSSGKVTIKELQKVVDVDGATFRFDDVPMGTYTLEASGDLSGFPVISDPDSPTKATPKPPSQATDSDHKIKLVRPKPKKS